MRYASEDDSAKRKRAADADMAELKLEQMRGALIPIDVFHDECQELGAVIKKAIGSLCSDCRAHMVDALEESARFGEPHAKKDPSPAH